MEKRLYFYQNDKAIFIFEAECKADAYDRLMTWLKCTQPNDQVDRDAITLKAIEHATNGIVEYRKSDGMIVL